MPERYEWERERDRDRNRDWDRDREREFAPGRSDWDRSRLREGRGYGAERWGEGREDWGRGREDWGREDWRREGERRGTEYYRPFEHSERVTWVNRPEGERNRDWERSRDWDRNRAWGRENYGAGYYGGGMGTYYGESGYNPTYAGGWGAYVGRGEGERGRFTGRGPKGWRRSDERIREDVNERLTYHPEVDASEIEVAVKDGEVTLGGRVDDRRAKRIAEDIAEQVLGVKDVHNQIRVEEREGELEHVRQTTATTIPTTGQKR